MNKGRWAAALVLVALVPTASNAASIGVSVFGGASIPIVQEDTGAGAQFGLRLPINVARLLTLEPFYAHSALGDANETFGGTEYSRSGFDVDAFGLNVLLSDSGWLGGFPLYPYGSIASHTLKRDGSADITEVGYEVGLGLGLPLSHGIGIGIRGGLDIVVTGETSRKFVNVTLGLSYKFADLGAKEVK